MFYIYLYIYTYYLLQNSPSIPVPAFRHYLTNKSKHGHANVKDTNKVHATRWQTDMSAQSFAEIEECGNVHFALVATCAPALELLALTCEASESAN